MASCGGARLPKGTLVGEKESTDAEANRALGRCPDPRQSKWPILFGPFRCAVVLAGRYPVAPVPVFSPADVRAILSDRKAKGFSAVLVMLIGYENDPMANINGDLPLDRRRPLPAQ